MRVLASAEAYGWLAPLVRLFPMDTLRRWNDYVGMIQQEQQMRSVPLALSVPFLSSALCARAHTPAHRTSARPSRPRHAERRPGLHERRPGLQKRLCGRYAMHTSGGWLDMHSDGSIGACRFSPTQSTGSGIARWYAYSQRTCTTRQRPRLVRACSAYDARRRHHAMYNKRLDPASLSLRCS